MSGDDAELLAFASSFTHFAGPNNPVLDLGNYLAGTMGVRFSVVTTSGAIDPSFAKSLRFPVRQGLAGTSSSMLERLRLGPANTRRARRILAGAKPRHTIVFSSLDTAFEVSWAKRAPILLGWNVLLNVPQRKWSERFGVPLWHPRSWRNPIYETLDRYASRTITGGILAHSHFQERLYRALGIPSDRIRVVPHCVDVRRFQGALATPPVPEAPSGNVVLYVGNLEPWKGIRELVGAAAAASEHLPVRLRFVGRGSLAPSLRALSEKPPAARLRIEMVPWTPPPGLFQEIRNAAVVVLPTYLELFGMAALEGMTLGKPIIATRFGGIAEVVRDGVDGYLIDPFDVDGFASAIVRVLQDAALRDRLGSAAREHVSREYDVSAIAPRFLQAVEALA